MDSELLLSEAPKIRLIDMGNKSAQSATINYHSTGDQMEAHIMGGEKKKNNTLTRYEEK